MYLDVTELRDFYHQPLGISVRRHIRHKIRESWGSVRGLNVFGLGFSSPFLGTFKGEAARLGALMPANQGVIMWPSNGPFLSALTEESKLPMPDASIDRCMLVHSLEMSEAPRELLREVWRVLSPEGRIMIIVPNRRGVWARFDTTPFGYGRPFSRGQVKRLLNDTMFVPTQWEYTLYMPPVRLSLLLGAMNAWEKIGSTCWPYFSGVMIIEASKQLYARTPKTEVKIISEIAQIRFK